GRRSRRQLLRRATAAQRAADASLPGQARRGSRLALRAHARRRAAAVAGADAQESRDPLLDAAHAADAPLRGERGWRRERLRDRGDPRARRRLRVPQPAGREVSLPPVMRILFTLQYLGTRYAGW